MYVTIVIIFNQIDISENKFADFFVCVTKNNNFVRLFENSKDHCTDITFYDLRSSMLFLVYRRNGNDRRIKQKIIQPFLSLSQIACDVVCDFYLFLDFYFPDSEFSFSAYSFHFGNFSFKMVATREFSFNRNCDTRLF